MIATIHHTTGHAIRQICVTLEVPRSSYYHAAEPTPMQSSDEEIGLEIEAIFKRHRRRYGYRRIMKQLADQGITGGTGLNLNLTGFQNPYTGTFATTVTGTDLFLNYSAIPEPSTVTLFGLTLATLARRRTLSPANFRA